MRIEAYNQVAQIYGNKTAKAKTSVNQAASYGKDEVQISSFGKDLQVAKQEVKSSPDVREDKVAQLKSQIDAGTYSVNTDDFAGILLEKFQTKY
ncbi:MAG: flagellar biosynthesis anti-sigma factor FlgM [Lachnospiraceae bacterium]|jgi:negative regulator of flagellin synthesis FlgM|nr:flagellar biosynthesis anti-sigma factor FlgM [Lachnospiraceae bacterium]